VHYPLVSVGLHPGAGQSLDQIVINTCQALRLVLDTFPEWARNLKRRLSDARRALSLRYAPVERSWKQGCHHH
jgi:hypothetical protein